MGTGVVGAVTILKEKVNVRINWIMHSFVPVDVNSVDTGMVVTAEVAPDECPG